MADTKPRFEQFATDDLSDAITNPTPIVRPGGVDPSSTNPFATLADIAHSIRFSAFKGAGSGGFAGIPAVANYTGEDYDPGNHFNLVSGLFIAPLTGFYTFKLHVNFTGLLGPGAQPPAAGDQRGISIRVNGAGVQQLVAVGAHAENQPGMYMALDWFLTAGDDVGAGAGADNAGTYSSLRLQGRLLA